MNNPIQEKLKELLDLAAVEDKETRVNLIREWMAYSFKDYGMVSYINKDHLEELGTMGEVDEYMKIAKQDAIDLLVRNLASRGDLSFRKFTREEIAKESKENFISDSVSLWKTSLTVLSSKPFELKG